MDNLEDKLQIVAFSTNDSRHTPNDIISIFLDQHDHTIIQNSNKVIAFSTILRNCTESTKIMICSILNLTVEYKGINEVNCYIIFIDLENEDSKIKFNSIINYFKDFCELSKKVFVLGMLSGSSECKYIEKEYIIRNLEKAKIDYAYKEINLNKIKEISDCIMEIFVYCNENTLYYDISNFDKDKERGQGNSCGIF